MSAATIARLTITLDNVSPRFNPRPRDIQTAPVNDKIRVPGRVLTDDALHCEFGCIGESVSST
jgi:hypothetical protein